MSHSPHLSATRHGYHSLSASNLPPLLPGLNQQVSVGPGTTGPDLNHTRLTGAAEQEDILDHLTEVKHWDLVPGSAGSQVPENLMDDEDAEGRSQSEQLAETGVAEAEEDQIRQAARADAQNQQG